MAKILCLELRHTINQRTGSSRYYSFDAGEWVRVSKADYQKRESEAFRHDTFSTLICGDLIQHTKTVYFFPNHLARQLAETQKTQQSAKSAGGQL